MMLELAVLLIGFLAGYATREWGFSSPTQAMAGEILVLNNNKQSCQAGVQREHARTFYHNQRLKSSQNQRQQIKVPNDKCVLLLRLYRSAPQALLERLQIHSIVLAFNVR